MLPIYDEFSDYLQFISAESTTQIEILEVAVKTDGVQADYSLGISSKVCTSPMTDCINPFWEGIQQQDIQLAKLQPHVGSKDHSLMKSDASSNDVSRNIQAEFESKKICGRDAVEAKAEEQAYYSGCRLEDVFPK